MKAFKNELTKLLWKYVGTILAPKTSFLISKNLCRHSGKRVLIHSNTEVDLKIVKITFLRCEQNQ